MGKIGGLALGMTLSPIAVGSLGYAATRVNWPLLANNFFTGPGRISRILMLIFAIFNWKNMPFVWTYRVFYAIFYHYFFRRSPQLGPRALFKPIITRSQAPILEIDYNLHKSNSTYFSDIDVSRTHLVTYLLQPATRKLADNAKWKLVLDPKSGEPIKGSFGIALGSVMCSFRREIPGYSTYEMWSRIISWDRKWLYMVTHILPKGTAKPTEWLDPGFGGVRVRTPKDSSNGWEKKIHATAISKYVFKVGRFTVHPAIVMDNAGLLPERPGGWMSGDNQLGDESVDVSDIDVSVEGEWNWRRTEAQRRKGMEMAEHFHALDGLHETFDCGNNGAIARFLPG